MSDRAPSKAQRWHPVPKSWLAAQARERDFLRKEFGQVRDLIPTLMKHRNGSQWSPEERQLLMIQFRSLAHLSPYLVVLVLPGSFVALPALAWWLDRRRQNRQVGPE
ncbi:MAG: hypothetical protein IPG34_17035 [Rhodocyclaceae bacterium]|nr:hypothetical protein [Rhodocyclaceae bacterium]